MRMFRPFPHVEVAEALSRTRAICVMDRSLAMGAPMGPLASDVASSLATGRRVPPLYNAVYGLGGRDITIEDFEGVIEEAAEVAIAGAAKVPVRYVGLRGNEE